MRESEKGKSNEWEERNGRDREEADGASRFESESPDALAIAERFIAVARLTLIFYTKSHIIFLHTYDAVVGLTEVGYSKYHELNENVFIAYSPS